MPPIPHNIHTLPGGVLHEAEAWSTMFDMESEVAQAVIADPPYFRVQDETKKWDHQWSTPDEYLRWTQQWVRQAMRILKPDGLCFIFGQVGKREHVFLHVMSALAKDFQFHDLLIWDRVIGYERSDSFQPQYEMILVLRNSDAPKFRKDAVRVPYSVEKIETYLRDKRYKDMDRRRQHLASGKFATNILAVPSLKGASAEKCGHPTQKPLDLIEKLVLVSTDPGDTVMDPFMGSGTTAQAALVHGRQWVGIENDPVYVEMMQERLAQLTTPTP